MTEVPYLQNLRLFSNLLRRKSSLAIGALQWNNNQCKVINVEFDLTLNRLGCVEEEKTTFHHHIDITYQIAWERGPLLKRFLITNLYHTCIILTPEEKCKNLRPKDNPNLHFEYSCKEDFLQCWASIPDTQVSRNQF